MLTLLNKVNNCNRAQCRYHLSARRNFSKVKYARALQGFEIGDSAKVWADSKKLMHFRKINLQRCSYRFESNLDGIIWHLELGLARLIYKKTTNFSQRFGPYLWSHQRSDNNWDLFDFSSVMPKIRVSIPASSRTTNPLYMFHNFQISHFFLAFLQSEVLPQLDFLIWGSLLYWKRKVILYNFHAVLRFL